MGINQSADARALLAAIVESSDDAIVSKDLNSIITSWNAGAERLFGYTAAEAIGQSITMLIPIDRAGEEPNILQRIQRGERIEHFETIRRRKDGSLIEISLTVSPVTDEQGKVVGASKIARDITDRKRFERALLDADRQKNEFLAMLAHELRNPLAPIRDSLNVLRLTGSAEPAVSRIYDVMERQVNQLVHLVDDLLEISRITTGKIQLRLEKIDLAQVIRSSIETSRPLINAASHELTTHLSTEPLYVEGDGVRLSQVVANLLNNAAKFTDPHGQISLSLTRVGNEAVISVRDSGIGIAPEELPRILEMFMQADRPKRRPQDGLGIGLALVKRLVELHEGHVEARSEGEGCGSEFVIRLPLIRSQNLPAAAADSPRFGVNEKMKQRILVVDDNQDAAISLAMLLRILGNDLETANDGRAALQSFETFHPSVVLLDLGMPEMNGFEVARRIRALPQGESVTLVALTGWGQEEDRRRTREAGFDHHLVKPINLEALQALLKAAKDQVPGHEATPMLS